MGNNDLLHYWRGDGWKGGIGKNVADSVDSVLGTSATKLQDLSSVFVDTGLPSLNQHMGGGYPPGIVEIYGPESSGKTLLALHAVVGGQRDGKTVAWVSTEPWDEGYAERVGVKTEDVVLMMGRNPEHLISCMLEFLGGVKKGVLVLDSSSTLYGPNYSWGDWARAFHEFTLRLRDTMLGGNCLVSTSQVRVRKSGNKFVSGHESTSRRFTEMFDARIELSRKRVSENMFDLLVDVVRNPNAPPGRPIEFRKIRKGYGIID